MSDLPVGQLGNLNRADDLLRFLVPVNDQAIDTISDKGIPDFELSAPILDGAAELTGDSTLSSARRFGDISTYLNSPSDVPSLIDTGLEFDSKVFTPDPFFSTDFYAGTLSGEDLKLQLDIFEEAEPAVDFNPVPLADEAPEMVASTNVSDLYNGVVDDVQADDGVKNVIDAEFVEPEIVFNTPQPQLEVVQAEAQEAVRINDDIDQNEDVEVLPNQVAIEDQVEEEATKNQVVGQFNKDNVNVEVVKNDSTRRSISPVPTPANQLALGAIVSAPEAVKVVKKARKADNNLDGLAVVPTDAVKTTKNSGSGIQVSSTKVEAVKANSDQAVKSEAGTQDQAVKINSSANKATQAVKNDNDTEDSIEIGKIEDGTTEVRFSQSAPSSGASILDGFSAVKAPEAVGGPVQSQPGDSNTIHAGQQAAVLGTQAAKIPQDSVADKKDAKNVVDDANQKLQTVADKGSKDHGDGNQEGDKGLGVADLDQVDFEAELDTDAQLEDLLTKFADQVSGSDSDIAIS
jgi:hypothetical protein